MAEMHVSEDRKSVMIVDDLGGEEQLSIEEFISCYGYNPAEEIESILETKSEQEAARIDLYWGKFLELCRVAGKIMSNISIINNTEKGIYPVQVVVHDYFNGELTNVDSSVGKLYGYYQKTLSEFETLSGDLGYQPFADTDRERLWWFLILRKRREYVRKWARIYRKAGFAISPREIIVQSYRKQKSLWPKKWKEQGCPY